MLEFCLVCFNFQTEIEESPEVQKLAHTQSTSVSGPGELRESWACGTVPSLELRCMLRVISPPTSPGEVMNLPYSWLFLSGLKCVLPSICLGSLWGKGEGQRAGSNESLLGTKHI